MSKYNYQYDFKCCDCGTDNDIASYLYLDGKGIEFHLCGSCLEGRENIKYKFAELSDKAKAFAVFNYVMGETAPILFADAWKFHIDNEDQWLFDEDGEYID
jgi:hypothetical protein